MRIPDGIVDEIASFNQVDNIEAKKYILNKLKEFKKCYSDPNYSLLCWSKSDRLIFQVAAANYVFSKAMSDRMLLDIQLCDEVILLLEDLLVFTFNCEKLHQLIARVEAFLSKLDENCLSCFTDVISALIHWNQSGFPENANANDQYLKSVFDVAVSKIPTVVKKEHHKRFINDRLERLKKIRASIH